jgi:hypothetical protein
MLDFVSYYNIQPACGAWIESRCRQLPKKSFVRHQMSKTEYEFLPERSNGLRSLKDRNHSTSSWPLGKPLPNSKMSIQYCLSVFKSRVDALHIPLRLLPQLPSIMHFDLHSTNEADMELEGPVHELLSSKNRVPGPTGPPANLYTNQGVRDQNLRPHHEGTTHCRN